MELTPALATGRHEKTHRLIPSRYPTTGILDLVASPEDLEAVQELESWTNDRISTELGILHIMPRSEWVTGRSNATVIMAAFCHPPIGGARFTRSRGGWYAAVDQETAIRETAYHRAAEFHEIGYREGRVEMREYLADFECSFHDVRPRPDYDACHDPESYEAGQALGEALMAEGSNGIMYRSVRNPGGECLVCFRPPLVLKVTQACHFEYVWDGSEKPLVRELRAT